MAGILNPVILNQSLAEAAKLDRPGKVSQRTLQANHPQYQRGLGLQLAMLSEHPGAHFVPLARPSGTASLAPLSNHTHQQSKAYRKTNSRNQAEGRDSPCSLCFLPFSWDTICSSAEVVAHNPGKQML